MLCVLTEILSVLHIKRETKKKERLLKAFQISHFYWSYSNDIVAVKGLKRECQWKLPRGAKQLQETWISAS